MRLSLTEFPGEIPRLNSLSALSSSARIHALPLPSPPFSRSLSYPREWRPKCGRTRCCASPFFPLRQKSGQGSASGIITTDPWREPEKKTIEFRTPEEAIFFGRRFSIIRFDSILRLDLARRMWALFFALFSRFKWPPTFSVPCSRRFEYS